ncbi:MAG TPA: hypothetical protein VNA04_12910, partial [Thermoanaerobaculia bacterium]|nr:hypothetical protein [Thermoanaerobaculia bacterium]
MTEDIRTICTCQVHARRERTLWRRSVRAARRATGNLKARGIALLVSAPLALGAFEFPTEAMHHAVTTFPAAELAAALEPATPASPAPAAEGEPGAELPIFTTEARRQQFLAPADEQQTLTLDMVKEQFFRSHVPYGSIIYREARRNNLPPEL